MGKAFVTIPVGVALAGMRTSLECEGATVADVLADCVAQEPRLRERIFKADGTTWVAVFVNGANVFPETALSSERGLATSIDDGDQIRLIPAVGAC